jgi:hypothetical protein
MSPISDRPKCLFCEQSKWGVVLRLLAVFGVVLLTSSLPAGATMFVLLVASPEPGPMTIEVVNSSLELTARMSWPLVVLGVVLCLRGSLERVIENMADFMARTQNMTVTAGSSTVSASVARPPENAVTSPHNGDLPKGG